MKIFNEIWVARKYQLFKRDMPRVSNKLNSEEFEKLAVEILFVSSKSAEHNFCLSDKTIKRIKDILQEDIFEN